jgi:hypothetical protein
MTAGIAIGAWVLGSLVLGLLLGRLVGALKRRPQA